MPEYTLVYKGEATDMSEMTPEQGQEVMAKWAEWMEKIGSALIDIGTPFGPNSSVVDDGSSGTVTSLSGYSVIEAADMDAARALVDGHPFLSESTGDYAVDIYEQMPAPI